MAGTKSGGKKTAATNKWKYGDDFYKKIGKLGGASNGRGGFYNNPELAKKAGKIGGRNGKRGKAKNKDSE